MMIDFKKYIGSLLVGKKLRFFCDCTFKIDVIGTVIELSSITSNEFVYTVKTDNGKIIHVGSNHPKMKVYEL